MMLNVAVWSGLCRISEPVWRTARTASVLHGLLVREKFNGNSSTNLVCRYHMYIIIYYHVSRITYITVAHKNRWTNWQKYYPLKIQSEAVLTFCAVLDRAIYWVAREIWEDWSLSAGRDSEVHEVVVIVWARPGAGARYIPDWEEQSHSTSQSSSHCRPHCLGQTVV